MAQEARRKAFNLWRIENDLSVAGIAQELGFSYQRLSFLIGSEKVTPQMHKRLSRVIPASLLPPAVPKTRSKAPQLQSATGS